MIVFALIHLTGLLSILLTWPAIANSKLNMKRKRILVTSVFLLGTITLINGVYLKVNHFAYADSLITIGLIMTVIVTLLALYEIHSSSKVQRTEKLLWTLGFLMMNTITGFLYFIIYRKEIINKQEGWFFV